MKLSKTAVFFLWLLEIEVITVFEWEATFHILSLRNVLSKDTRVDSRSIQEVRYLIEVVFCWLLIQHFIKLLNNDLLVRQVDVIDIIIEHATDSLRHQTVAEVHSRALTRQFWVILKIWDITVWLFGLTKEAPPLVKILLTWFHLLAISRHCYTAIDNRRLALSQTIDAILSLPFRHLIFLSIFLMHDRLAILHSRWFNQFRLDTSQLSSFFSRETYTHATWAFFKTLETLLEETSQFDSHWWLLLVLWI